MVRRVLECLPSDYAGYSAEELKQAIWAAEGRTVCCEMVAPVPAYISNLTNAEIAKAFGADLMLLNGLDVLNPVICGLDQGTEDPIRRLKALSGRPIGANLEPVNADAIMVEARNVLPKGRTCSVETLEAADRLGLDFICLTGNPGTGVTNKEIAHYVKVAKQHFSGLVIAGKMHGAGSKEPVASIETAKDFIEAGTDILLVPAVGTVPGFTDDELVAIVKYAHAHDVLVLSAIGTSQESSSPRVVEDIAIRNKVAGVDIQHIGDAGFGGLANVENIFALSVAIRGMRHTVSRVAGSAIR